MFVDELRHPFQQSRAGLGEHLPVMTRTPSAPSHERRMPPSAPLRQAPDTQRCARAQQAAAVRWSPAAFRRQFRPGPVDGRPTRCWAERHTGRVCGRERTPWTADKGICREVAGGAPRRSSGSSPGGADLLVRDLSVGPRARPASGVAGGARGGCGDGARRQRRRQVHAAAGRLAAPSGFHRGARHGRPVRSASAVLDGRAPVRVVAAGVVPGPGGAPGVRRMTVADNLRAGAPRRRAGGRADRARALSRVHALFPVLAERAPAARRAAVRRRAADAGHRPGPDGRAPAAAARRALPRPRPADGARGSPRRSGRSTPRAPPSCSSSRTRPWPCGSPPTAYVLEVGEVTLSGPADELAAHRRGTPPLPRRGRRDAAADAAA